MNSAQITKRLSSKSAFQSALVVTIFGFILLLVSQISLPVGSGMEYKELSRFSSPQTALFFQKSGIYYINKTNGEVFLDNSSKIRVYDDREQLVFSLPLADFPSQFAVDSTGYYVVILENVIFDNSAELSVLEANQKYVASAPFNTLVYPSSLVLVIGFASIGCVLALRSIQIRREREDYMKALEWNFGIGHLFEACLSILIIPLFIATIVASMFAKSGGIHPNWVAVVWFVAVVIGVIYSLKLKAIANAYVSIYGYKGIVLLKKIVLFLIVTEYALLAVVVVTSATFPPQANLALEPIMTLIMISFICIFALLIPFLDPLEYKVEASVSLHEFLSNYRLRPNDAENFSLIKHASKSTVMLLRSYNHRISPDELAEKISIDLLDTEVAEERKLIHRLLGALDPFNVGALVSVAKDVGGLEENLGKGRFEWILTCLSYVAVIVGSVGPLLVILLGK